MRRRGMEHHLILAPQHPLPILPLPGLRDRRGGSCRWAYFQPNN